MSDLHLFAAPVLMKYLIPISLIPFQSTGEKKKGRKSAEYTIFSCKVLCVCKLAVLGFKGDSSPRYENFDSQGR